MDKKDIDSGFNLCLNYLSISIRTKKQIRDYLHKKQYEDEIIDGVIEKLEEYNFIDDRNYANSMINSYKSKCKSKAEIKFKMASKGINREIIEEALQNEITEDEETDYAVKLVTKYYDRVAIEDLAEDEKYKFESKIKSKLYQKGFKIDTINRAINIYIDSTYGQ